MTSSRQVARSPRTEPSDAATEVADLAEAALDASVTAWLARGLSNRQIADEQVIARATVERHVANMLVKLDFHSRSQIAQWAAERGLR